MSLLLLLSFKISEHHHVLVNIIHPLDGSTTGPVSYTHLDVYKRQGLESIFLYISREGGDMSLMISWG